MKKVIYENKVDKKPFFGSECSYCSSFFVCNENDCDSINKDSISVEENPDIINKILESSNVIYLSQCPVCGMWNEVKKISEGQLRSFVRKMLYEKYFVQ